MQRFDFLLKTILGINTKQPTRNDGFNWFNDVPSNNAARTQFFFSRIERIYIF
jgi:hypothetical protein